MTLKVTLTLAFLFTCLNVTAHGTAPSKKCRVTYLSQSDLKKLKQSGAPIETVSNAINSLLKSSLNFAKLVDKYTLGMASHFTLGRLANENVDFEDITPNQWNKVNLSGTVVYKNEPFSLIPLKRTKVDISFEKKLINVTSGVHGEFSHAFYKLIPYTRFKLFPISIQRKMRLQNTLSSPIHIEVQSKICSGELDIRKIPLEPITLILTPILESNL